MSNKILIVLLSLIFCSCLGQEQNSGKKQITPKKKVQKWESQEEINKLFSSIDSITVSGLFYGKPPKTFTLHFSERSLVVFFHHGDEKKIIINSPYKKNKLANYINKFYINKDETIILERKKREEIVATNYPFIIIEGYRQGKSVLKDKTSIGEESYEIEFNPEFLEFYEFLDNLFNKK